MPHELSSEMRAALGDPDVRSSVTEAVRRRVPGDDVPDVAQAVFCEALDSETGPAKSEEIPYWLVGIARHTAANYFRKRPRELPAREADGTELPESISLPPRFEVRQAISRVLDSLGEGAKKTLFWMVLEHEGVELQAIAKEERMSPAAVRARVYRLRRTLRKELAYLLVGVILLGGVLQALRASWPEPIRAVAPTPSAPRAFPPSTPHEVVGGHVEPMTPLPPLSVAPTVSTAPPPLPVPSAAPSSSSAPPLLAAPSASAPPVPSAVLMRPLPSRTTEEGPPHSSRPTPAAASTAVVPTGSSM